MCNIFISVTLGLVIQAYVTLGLSAAIWLVLYHWETYNSYIKFLFEIWFNIIY